MPRGGYRKNAGRKKKWKSGKTTSIRVPIALADQVLEIAHIIDEGNVIKIENDSNSKVLELYDIPTTLVENRRMVSLVDLLVAGYEIKPLALVEMIRQEYLNEKNE